MNSEKSEEERTRQQESSSVGHRFPRGLTMLPLMSLPTRDFLLFLLDKYILFYPSSLVKWKHRQQFLLKLLYIYIYIYLINICIVGSMTPSMSKVTIPPPSFPRPVVLGSGILLSAEEGTMVGARYPIEKKRPAAGPGTIFHYILRASITLNNDVHKIRPCALVRPA